MLKEADHNDTSRISFSSVSIRKLRLHEANLCRSIHDNPERASSHNQRRRPLYWTHTAFCITAAVIICFEISYCANLGDRNVDIYREAVQAARDRLAARKEDLLAARGVTLIDAIALEQSDFDVQPHSQGLISARKIINLPRVVENFFMADKPDSTRDILDRMADTLPFEFEESIEQSLGGEMTLPVFYDFDEWFNSAFNERQASN